MVLWESHFHHHAGLGSPLFYTTYVQILAGWTFPLGSPPECQALITSYPGQQKSLQSHLSRIILLVIDDSLLRPIFKHAPLRLRLFGGFQIHRILSKPFKEVSNEVYLPISSPLPTALPLPISFPGPLSCACTFPCICHAMSSSWMAFPSLAHTLPSGKSFMM